MRYKIVVANVSCVFVCLFGGLRVTDEVKYALFNQGMINLIRQSNERSTCGDRTSCEPYILRTFSS